MYHQNLGSRRFNNLTYELLYQTPRQFSGSFPAASPYKPQTRPSFGNRAASTSSTNSSSSSPARNNNKGSFRRKSQKTSKIAAAAAFAEEKEQRGRRKQRVSTATTVNGDGVVHEVGVDDLKHAAMAEEEGGEGFRDRKSSATLSIVLNQYEQEMNSRTGTAEGDVGEYVENVESRIPNGEFLSTFFFPPSIFSKEESRISGCREKLIFFFDTRSSI